MTNWTVECAENSSGWSASPAIFHVSGPTDNKSDTNTGIIVLDRFVAEHSRDKLSFQSCNFIAPNGNRFSYYKIAEWAGRLPESNPDREASGVGLEARIGTFVSGTGISWLLGPTLQGRWDESSQVRASLLLGGMSLDRDNLHVAHSLQFQASVLYSVVTKTGEHETSGSLFTGPTLTGLFPRGHITTTDQSLGLDDSGMSFNWVFGVSLNFGPVGSASLSAAPGIYSFHAGPADSNGVSKTFVNVPISLGGTLFFRETAIRLGNAQAHQKYEITVQPAKDGSFRFTKGEEVHVEIFSNDYINQTLIIQLFGYRKTVNLHNGKNVVTFNISQRPWADRVQIIDKIFDTDVYLVVDNQEIWANP